MNTFLKGSFLLAGTAFISECIEFLINMSLTKELGEYGVGQYMSIIPVVGLVMIIASLELPISISKFVAEKEAKYHLPLLKYAMKLALIFICISMSIAALLFSVFPLFGEIHPFVRWLILLLIPIVAISSIARGYFMGIQKMGKIAVANLFRRCMQLFILVLIYQMFNFPFEISILIALCSLVAGELLVLIYLISAYVLQLKHLKNQPFVSLPKNVIVKSLLEVSVPTTAMRIFHSITHTIQPFLIKYALVSGGLTMTSATEQFGLVAGVAMTIGFFPAFIAQSLMTVLIPNVSNAYVNRDQQSLLRLLRQVIFVTLLYGIPASVLFYFYGGRLTTLFVDSPIAAYYLQLLWPYFLLHYFTIPLQAFLIGMGLIKDAFLHSIWCTVLSFIMMYLLGSRGEFLMDGVIIGMNTGAVLLMLLHYFTVCKKIGITVTLHRKEHMSY